MECKDYREQFPLLLSNNLDPTQKSGVEDHLAECPECRQEFEAIRKIWDLMGEIPQPEPSGSLKTSFGSVLSNYKEELYSRRKPVSDWLIRLREYWIIQVQPRMALSLLLIAVGLFLGYFLHRPGESVISYNNQIDSLSSQVSDLKQVMMLSLLQDPSASKRIKGVSYTDDMSNVNTKVINALFTTLNSDPNVNVRLATLEALIKLSGEPKVREGLVRSIDLQDSPIMQSAIADAMVKLQEKSSVKNLERLLSKKNLNQMVKIKVEKSIQKLI
jgi:Putative zinc-finger